MSNPQTERLEQMYALARSARASNDATTAKKYYDMILETDPLNWEPVFYSVYYTYATMKNGEIGHKAIEISNCLNTVLLMIGQMTDVDEKNKVLVELGNSISTIASILQSASVGFYNSLPALAKNPLDKLSRTVIIGDLLFNMGDALQKNGLNLEAIELYKHAIQILDTEIFLSSVTNPPAQYQPVLDKMLAVSKKIQEYDPSFRTKKEAFKEKLDAANQNAKTNKKGCYVATCVYGSYDCPEVWTLRRFRDNTLGSTWYGRAFIRVYYATSPTLVKWFGHTEWFKKICKGMLDKFVTELNESGVENTSYNDKNW